MLKKSSIHGISTKQPLSSNFAFYSSSFKVSLSKQTLGSFLLLLRSSILPLHLQPGIYFSFRSPPECCHIAGFCLFCHLSWEIIKHYVEYSNKNYIFKIAKILIVLHSNLYTNIKGTKKCLVSNTPP